MTMKINAAAFALLSTALSPALVLAQEQCVSGGFRLEFNGQCTPDAIVAAYESQVFNASGGTPEGCALTARADLEAKLPAAGIDTGLQGLCDRVYAAQYKVPFSSAADRGDDMRFEGMFYNGHTDWQEEVETNYETEDETPTNVLKEDAEQVRVFFDGIAQGQRVDWPGALPNFQSSVTDADSLATCTTNAAMCCWPKDRQANDNNGNCAEPYDVNCVDKDPADNTDLCFVDMERGNSSTNFDSTDTVVFPGDNNQGEGAIHCHGLAWSNDVNDATARYKGNNLFYVSMYDHMYVRGYVENIPGAPMCGCVEQMPTVSRSDCTQVDLTESISISYDPRASGTFITRIEAVDVEFNACQGIDNRNNDLWAYMARLYYQKDITPEQFGEAGRIITDTGCTEATSYELDRRNLTPGYDHDVSLWTNVAGRESMRLHDTYGARAWNLSMRGGDRPSASNPHHGIIYRACHSCIRTHKKIYYRRRTPVPEDYSLMDTVLYNEDDGGGRNVWGTDFDLYSTLEDALDDVDAWKCPNGQFKLSATFYGHCSPDGSRVENQRSQFDEWNQRTNVAYFVYKAEEDGLDIVPSGEDVAVSGGGGDVPYRVAAVAGRDWAGGMALRDPVTGTIYMTGSGRDIGGSEGDDFNYLSQPANGDYTVIVHASKISSSSPHHWSKSGIMFRTNAEEYSAYFAIYLTGGEGICAQGRQAAGQGYNHWGCVNKGTTEAWLKIEKRMDTYTSFYGTESADADAGEIDWTVHKSIDLPNVEASEKSSVVTSLAVATQSSTSYNALASRAIDGKASYHFTGGSVMHTNDEANPWWMVDLGMTDVTISGVTVYNRSDSCCRSRMQDAIIQILADDGSVLASQTFAGTHNVYEFSFGDIVGRSVKITKDFGTSNGPLNIAEVKVWGTYDGMPAPPEPGSFEVGLAVCSARSHAQEVVFAEYEVDQYYFPSAAPSTSSMPTVQGAGKATWEIWNDLSGGSVASLTGNANYPHSPTRTDTITDYLEIPPNTMDSFGSRLKTYITAPATGAYTFYIACDDACELLLSATDSRADRAKVAFTNRWTSHRQWGKYPNDQRSDPIDLVEGEMYYIEALHKEGGGGDNLSIGWTMPGSANIKVIEGQYFSWHPSWDETSAPAATPAVEESARRLRG